MATGKEFDALYHTGKQLEAREEGRLPEMAGSTDFYEILGKALVEAKNEGGKIVMEFNHPTQVLIRVFGCTLRFGETEYFVRHEYTHYL